MLGQTDRPRCYTWCGEWENEANRLADLVDDSVVGQGQDEVSTGADQQAGRIADPSARTAGAPAESSIDADSAVHAAVAWLDPRDRELLDGHGERHLLALGLPPQELAVDRIRAWTEVRTLLGLQPRDIRCSPLGPAWSADLDVSTACEPVPMVEAGWLPADSFLHALGSPGSGRWLIRCEGRVIGQLDFAEDGGAITRSGTDAVAKAVARARSRGRVELRDVLELRHHARSGATLPINEITRAAARMEAALAGDREVALELADIDRGREDGPVRLRNGATRRRASAVKRWARPRPVIALSGVDGAGKSSLTEAIQRDFRRMGIDPDVIWARPGMRMEWVEPFLGSRSKRGVPTVARVASGEDVDVSSRRGLVGWLWTMVVTGTFLSHVWWRHLSSSGVKIYDRHVDDAIITLDFVYDGVDLRFQRFLISSLLPRASITLYLSVDAETAVSRKPGDTFGRHAVETQLRHYADRMGDRHDIAVLDATRHPRDVASRAFAQIIERVR